MKIAIFNAYQGKVERGAERFVEELSVRLGKEHEVRIFTNKMLPLRRWPVVWRVFLDPPGLSIFWFTLKNLYRVWREKFDTVIPVNGGWQPALLRIITWLYGGKMVISGQSGPGWDDANNLWNFPNVFVTLSSYSKAWAKAINPFIRVEYIPNGVDLVKFKPRKQERGRSAKNPTILCVAALTPQKRIDLVIKAVSKISNARLLVVGQGDLKDELESLGNKLLPGRFSLISASFGEMPGIYSNADLFTLASEPSHSFEIVLIEAMAANLPVVANSDPIRQEIVGEAGILVDPKDTDSYAKALEEALKKDWGDKPRKQAEKFSWDIIADQYQKLFHSLNEEPRTKVRGIFSSSKDSSFITR